MVWTKVVEIVREDNSSNYFVLFDYFGKMKNAYVTARVLDYCHIDSINLGDDIFVSKTFTGSNAVYLIRKVSKNEK